MLLDPDCGRVDHIRRYIDVRSIHFDDNAKWWPPLNIVHCIGMCCAGQGFGIEQPTNLRAAWYFEKQDAHQNLCAIGFVILTGFAGWLSQH